MSGGGGVKKLLRADLPHDLPEWAEKLIDSHNHNADQVAALQKAAPVSERRDVSFLTKATASDTFVPAMKVGFSFSPRIAKLVRVQNVTAPTAVAAVAAHLDYTLVEGGIVIRNVVGLLGSTRYILTIEAQP